jgi:hypothetical protein
MATLEKQQAVLRMPTGAEWDAWAHEFSRRSVAKQILWRLDDVLAKSPKAKQRFIELCEKGCNPGWLAKELMRLPTWDSGKSGRKPFAVDSRQKKVLKRVQKDLKQMLEWDFPMLIEPGAGETLFFKVREFEAALTAAMDGLPTNHLAGFAATNALHLAASETIRGIERQTGKPHFASALISFNAVLAAEGCTDRFNSEDNLKKAVKRNPRRTSKK